MYRNNIMPHFTICNSDLKSNCLITTFIDFLFNFYLNPKLPNSPHETFYDIPSFKKIINVHTFGATSNDFSIGT